MLSCAWLAFGALTLLVGRQEGHPACKKLSVGGAGMVICLEQGADLHTALLMPLPLTVSCSSKIQIGFTFLVPAHPGSPGQRAVKRVCVFVCSRCMCSRRSCQVQLVHWGKDSTANRRLRNSQHCPPARQQSTLMLAPCPLAPRHSSDHRCSDR